MTESNQDNTNNGGQEERPHVDQPSQEGGAEQEKHDERPARYPRRDDNGGERSFRPFKRSDDGERSYRPYRRRDDGGSRPYRPYNQDENNADGSRPYRPYKRREDGGDRPYRPYNRDENGGGDRPYRPYKRDENGGGDRPYRPYKRDENGEGGSRPYRPYKRDDNSEGGDRPYRPFKRDENGGGDRPYRRPFRRNENGEGGDRPYRPFRRDENGEGGDRPFKRDDNGESGDRPYRPFRRDENGGGERPYRPFRRDENGGSDRPYRPFKRDENGEGGDRPYRPFRRDENGSGDRPYRPPRRFDRDGNGAENGGADSERSIIDSDRKDDIAISGDRPYRPYHPYLMEDENGVMHASYRPFRKRFDRDEEGGDRPARPPRRFENRDERSPRPSDGDGADSANWSFSSQEENGDKDNGKLLPEQDGSAELKPEEIQPTAAEPVAAPANGFENEEPMQVLEPEEQEKDSTENVDTEGAEAKDGGQEDSLPPRLRFANRNDDGGDRPPRRYGRYDDGDRPPRRFSRDEDGGDRPRRFFNRDENGEDRPPRRSFGEQGDATVNQEEETLLPYARKRRIAVFGGSFDPIHNGHLLIAQKVVELEKVDEVLFVPALQPPHKIDALSATPEQRLEMVSLALQPYEKFSFTDVELKREGMPSYTFDTMAVLNKIYSDCELFLLIGMDSLLGLHSWYRAPELVTRGKFIVYPRPGVERPPIHQLENEFGSKNAYKLFYSILDDEELAQSDISSTAIREAIAQHLSLEKLVPQAVAQYIHEQHIYS